MRPSGKITLVIGGLLTTGMALYHFWLPSIWKWNNFVSTIPGTISWGLFSINFFFSLLLLSGGILTILIALKRDRAQPFSLYFLFSLAIFWLANLGYQVFIPMPAPLHIRIILLTFATTVLLLYIFPIIQILKTKPYSE